MGVAMRAVADSQQVAMAMGINVRRYFAFAWALAGVVSALAGLVWGAMIGVDNQLAVVGLKVFPVVILGGLDSIVGAVVGGLIVGVAENLADRMCVLPIRSTVSEEDKDEMISIVIDVLSRAAGI